MMRVASVFLALFSLSLAICVPTQASTVSGLVYHDDNRTSLSLYVQNVDYADVPLQGIKVSLISAHDELTATTNGDGIFEFDGLDQGNYLLDVGISNDHDCTSNNHPARAAEAVRDGYINIVAIGDSIGVIGSDVLYPERLGEHFAGLADVEVTNVAVGGTTTVDWLPGVDGSYFESRLLPVLPDADVVTMTLGGNDPLRWFNTVPPEDIQDIIEFIENIIDHPEYVIEIVINLKIIIREIQQVNPECDVVFVVYPNFANTIFWRLILGEKIFGYGVQGVYTIFSISRHEVGSLDHIVISDTLEAHGDHMIQDYLKDLIHPNDYGHQFYANTIFKALGGVIIEDGKQNDVRMFGYYAPELVPPDWDDDDDTGDDDSDDDDDIDDDDSEDDDDDDDDTEADGDDDDEGSCSG